MRSMTVLRRFRRPLAGAALAAALAAAPAAATTVQVIGLGPAQVEIIVNGTTVRALRAGQTSPEGVRALAIGGGRAVLEIDGERQELALGQSNLSAVVLTADPRGQFYTTAYVNGRPIRAVVDTGASSVVMGVREAEQLGIAYRSGRQVPLRTTGGDFTGWVVTLPSLRVGSIAVADVEGLVNPGQALGFILLGSSFLDRVELQRRGETLLLLPRR